MPVPSTPTPSRSGALLPPGADAPGVPLHGAEELAVTTRSGFVESRHLGHAVLVDPDGEVVVAVGDPAALVNPRSSLKPIQAATCLLAGAPLAGAGLAIGAGSHLGHPDHVDLVRSVLADAGLDTDALQTPPAWPTEAWARDDRVRAGGGHDPVHHNCSGKHAAMVVACVVAGWDPTTYRAVDHPLQQAVRARVEEATGVPVAHVGVDGCGAPLFTTTPHGLARAMGVVARRAHERTHVGAPAGVPGSRLAEALGRVGAAMRAEPWAVAGIGAEDTVVMQELDGVVAKGGAEGVMALGTADGYGVVVKVLDGATRAAMPAALELLRAAGVADAPAVSDAIATRMLGHGVPVGRVHVADLVRTRVEAVDPA